LLETQGLPALNDYFEKLKSESNAKSSKAVSFIVKHESIREAIDLTKEVMNQVNKKTAEEAKEKLTAAGATVELK